MSHIDENIQHVHNLMMYVTVYNVCDLNCGLEKRTGFCITTMRSCISDSLYVNLSPKTNSKIIVDYPAYSPDLASDFFYSLK